MYDVYLGGINSHEWRTQFKNNISPDISIFDPCVKKFTENIKEQSIREFYFMDLSDLIVLYFNQKLSTPTLIYLGDIIGRRKSVIVCVDGKVPGRKFITNYCELKKVPIVYSFEELITSVESYMASLQLSAV